MYSTGTEGKGGLCGAHDPVHKIDTSHSAPQATSEAAPRGIGTRFMRRRRAWPLRGPRMTCRPFFWGACGMYPMLPCGMVHCVPPAHNITKQHPVFYPYARSRSGAHNAACFVHSLPTSHSPAHHQPQPQHRSRGCQIHQRITLSRIQQEATRNPSIIRVPMYKQ